MKKTTSVFIFALILFNFSFTHKDGTTLSPLQNFSAAWNDEIYEEANTARHAVYMSETERQVIHILNLMRMNASLFGSTVVRQYPEFKRNLKLRQSKYYKSLLVAIKHGCPSHFIAQ